ncbi:MAG: aminoglycoside phosphotransferase family protein [Acidimicrobiia bacterium]|nr:aminoglycoside phosphotransferase family protein [Acidimicrobiia bacterium]
MSAASNRVFRVRSDSGATTVVKVYSTAARERRERHAIEALAGVRGVPQILERGSNHGLPWIRMTDGGAWSLATLPKNTDTIARAGEVLRAVHDSGADITNLGSGIDDAYVRDHYRSTLDRLERYRRRLGLPAEVLQTAKASDRFPVASAPLPSHTRPHPRSFMVSELGEITLIEWEWATLAPPEWDLSLATWRFTRDLGADAAQAFWHGYGASFPQERLRPWIAYHSAMTMLEAAEQRDGRLGDLAYLVKDLSDSVA